MTRRPPKGGVGEPLFGEDWWTDDQRLFQDSLTRKTTQTAARRTRRPATLRKRDATALSGDGQAMLPWFEDPSGGPDESVRADGAGALGPVAAGPVRGDRGSDSFFSDLGSRTENRIDQLAAELAGDDQPGEGYLGKAGRLGEARHRAEQIVLSRDVLLEPEPGADDEQEGSPGRDLPWGLELLYPEDSPED